VTNQITTAKSPLSSALRSCGAGAALYAKAYSALRLDRELQRNRGKPEPKNYLNLVVQRGWMEGFLALDYMSRAADAIGALAGRVQAGKLR
jgi:hypothetical protein